MLVRIILAVALIIALYWCLNKWQKLPVSKRQGFLIKALIYGAFAFCLIAVFAGRAHWLAAAVTGGIAFAKFGLATFLRALPFLNLMRRGRVFGNPKFVTPFIELNIDLHNGQVFGRIISGPHAGTELAQLTPAQLAELEEHYQDKDRRSYFLIRVLRQRAGHQYQGGGPHEQHHGSQQHSHVTSSDPSIDEALQILGLENTPSKQDIIRAHRSLIQKLHPDRGGNDYLASRVNLAKEVLLKHLYSK
ncbi:MAG: molecular chaperone DnaJ [Agarilytica sp.]